MSLFWLKVGAGILGAGCICGIPLGLLLRGGNTSFLSSHYSTSELGGAENDYCTKALTESGEYDIDYSLVGRNWNSEDRQHVQRALKDHCEGKGPQ